MLPWGSMPTCPAIVISLAVLKMGVMAMWLYVGAGLWIDGGLWSCLENCGVSFVVGGGFEV